jgi:hypothetical protein
MCTDCHVAKSDDNNAIMAQLLMQGTQYLNFIGKYCWVAAGCDGLAAVVVTERDEPQAVIGSSLHRLAYPDDFARHVARGRLLKYAHEHPGRDISEQIAHPLRKADVRDVQVRGEYLYAACGEDGVRVFDVSMVDHKGFSEPVFTAPVSPLGQRFYVRTKCAMAVAAPTTIAPDPTRTHDPKNREASVHALYGYLYVADKYEGLILIGAATTINGNPLDNFLKREVTFNPDGLLDGARAVAIAGTRAYVCCDAGIVVVGLDDPKKPEVKGSIGPDLVRGPRCVQVQFRYAYVCDAEGVKVFDVTDPDRPKPVGKVDMPEANRIYLARTYAYVAAGRQGLVILDIEKAENPRIDQVFDAGGSINDCRDVKLGITYVSEFAYLADGKNGLRVVQLTSPETPGNDGFSPRPTPELVATFKTKGEVLAVSKGVDRDRAVDESGNQIAVFGRVGARPLSYEEQRKLYWRDGKVWKVSDDPCDTELYKNRGGVPCRQEKEPAPRPPCDAGPGGRKEGEDR